MPIRALVSTPRSTSASTATAEADAPAAAPAVRASDAFDVSGRVRELVLEEASRDVTLADLDRSATFEGVTLAASGKLTEKVVLSTVDNLVAGDSRRRAAAEDGKVWTKLGVGLNASAGAGVAVAQGVSASFGFASGAQLTAVVAGDKSLTMSNVTGTLRDQGELAAVALDPLRLLADDHTPGTELMIQGSASATAGVGLGVTSAARFANVNAGISAGLSKGTQFTKNVKVLGDGKVYVQVSKLNTTAGNVSAGLDARPEIPGSGLAGRAGDSVEKKLRLTASVGAGLSGERGLKMGGVFDLKTAEGRAAYVALMQANPLTLETNPQAAEEMLAKIRAGAAYSEVTRTGSVGANIDVAGKELLAFSSARRSTEGVLLETMGDGGELKHTTLSEQEYTRNVRGLLPRLTQGEERTVALRLGSVTRGGVESRAALMQLQLDDKKVTEAQQADLQRFAAAFGQTLPAATGKNGKGSMSVQVALTDENLQALSQRSSGELKMAFTEALEQVQGQPAPWRNDAPALKVPYYRHAPVKTVREEFRDAATGYASLSPHDDREELQKRQRDYRAATGRDLDDDVTSYIAMTTFSEQIEAGRGKPVGEWGPGLAALGKLGSADLRTALVALGKTSGASLVSLGIQANGASMSATGVTAPKSAAEWVGPVLTPAEVY